MTQSQMFPGLTTSAYEAVKASFEQVNKRLDAGAHLVISVSGGKDSDAMMWYLNRHWMKCYEGTISLVHADLGESEWKQTPAYVQGMSDRTGIPLYVVKKNGTSGLVEQMLWRMVKRPDAPPFPSSMARYCTSDMKKGPIDTFIRNRFPKNADVICAIGIRAEESPARARKPVLSTRETCESTTKSRTVSDWYPIFDWTTEDVKYYLRDVGMHPAYGLGNERLSCSICILGSLNDIMNGIENNPEVYSMLCAIEVMSGFSFRQGLWLKDLRPDLLADKIKHYDHKLYEPPTFDFAYEFSGLKAYNEKHVLS